jgi:hypothetical protein
MVSKAAYVKAQGQDRDHSCHWPGCPAQVPPAMWGCRGHWFTLPKPIRDDIWRAYRPGQERDMRPSRTYVEAAQAAQEWIAEYLAGQASVAPPTRSQQVRMADNKTRDLFDD